MSSTPPISARRARSTATQGPSRRCWTSRWKARSTCAPPTTPCPDLVVALHGQVDVDLSGRIDSVNGGIRSTFDLVPDAPVSKFVLTMKGGEKGLLVNSRHLCAGVNRATVKMEGQNGRTHDFRPAVKASCQKKRKTER